MKFTGPVQLVVALLAVAAPALSAQVARPAVMRYTTGRVRNLRFARR